MKQKVIHIDGRNCHIYQSEQPDFLLVQPIDKHDLELMDQEVAAIQRQTAKAFTLAAFEVGDWQNELTPWTAPAAFGKTPFGDGAVKTLDFVTHELIPVLRQLQLLGDRSMRLLLGGYSLAGLFALWAAYNTPVFHGIAAVSPSVWYQGWANYAMASTPQSAAIYLSLGDKEERTRNPIMAQVGTRIRHQHQLLSTQGVTTTLEWNPGNHFQDSDARIAKAFVWLMNNL